MKKPTKLIHTTIHSNNYESTFGPAATSAFPLVLSVYRSKFFINRNASSLAFLSYSLGSECVSRVSRIFGSTFGKETGTSKLKIVIVLVFALSIEPSSIASIIARVSVIEILFPVPFQPVLTR